MRTTTLLGFAAACAASASVLLQAQDAPLTRAKQLYEAASYSEALAALKQAGTGDVVEAETYRALCFLALGQPREAERALEHLVMTRPFATLDASSVSPRVVAIFDAVRKRTIPAAAKEMYQRARATFDQGDLESAAREFQEVVKLAESAPPDRAELMSELKMLATGFVRLAETPRKPAPAAAAAPSTPPAAQPQAERASAASNGVAGSVPRMAATVVGQPVPGAGGAPIFDASSPNIRPPIVVKRPIPAWPELSATTWKGNFKGLLEIVVDETGAVAESTLVERIHPVYDNLLLNAVRTWKFNPAINNGEPVRYRLRYPISVSER